MFLFDCEQLHLQVLGIDCCKSNHNSLFLQGYYRLVFSIMLTTSDIIHFIQKPLSSNFSNKTWEILGDDLERTAYLKAGINRLLYPQKYIHKGIVQVEEDNFILDDDKQDETVMSFCELIFFQYAFAYLIDNIFWYFQNKYISDILDVIKRRFYQVSNKKYATFQEVHMFLLYFRCTDYAKSIERILHIFQFSDKTIIELLNLLDEDRKYNENEPPMIKDFDSDEDNPDEEMKDGRVLIGYYDQDLDQQMFNFKAIDDLFNEMLRSSLVSNNEYHLKEEDFYEGFYNSFFTEESHRRFEKLIKRENYPPLFFAVLVYSIISGPTLPLDIVDFVFTDKEYFKLDTLNIKNASKDIKQVIGLACYYKLVQNNHPYSDCKFTEWVDEWLENFDSFVIKDEFSKKIASGSDEIEKDGIEIGYNIDDGISSLLLTRGWIVSKPLFDGIPKEIFKEYVENELKRTAMKYSIIQDCIPNEERSVINWWLSKTHYHTIFNKLVEYYSAAYFDNGQRQIPLQEAELSAAKKSNDDEQQNIPVIVIDTDEAHKEWFVRVHEKKIKAQPDEWNKKLYTCLDALYESLVKKGLMCESSKKELFIYRFSGFNIPKSFNPQEKIKWEGKNVLLGYIVRCLITYTGSDAKGLGTVGTFFESKKGKKVNLATADYISKEDFNQTPNMFPVLSLAVEILKECGFEEVEATSTRKRDK